MSYTETKSSIDLTDIEQETLKEKVLRACAIMLIVIFPLSLLCCFKVVKQYKRAVILRFGRVREVSPAGPGIIWVVPCTDSTILIDLRTQPLHLPQQQILTRDFVTVVVDAVLYFHVSKPLKCLLNVQSHMHATEMLAVSILRNTMGTYTLTDLLSSREVISKEVRFEVDLATVDWGVYMERVEIKDIVLPQDLQKAMTAEAEGKRLAKAKIIEAEGEIKTAEHLQTASKIMMENPQIMLLRYLQTLDFIASQQSTSIFFPFPLQIPNPIADLPTELPATASNVKNETSLLNQQHHDTMLERFLVFLSVMVVILFFPISLSCIFVVVRQFERIIILRNGKIYQSRVFGPGLICHLPCVDVIKYTDLRLVCYALPPQECITKDSLTVTIQSIIYYKIYDPLAAITNVANFKLSTQILATTTLRNAVSVVKLSELLVSKTAVSVHILHHMKRLTREWGIYVVRTEIKDIYLPLQLQTAMAVEAESSRLAHAKIIVSKAEIESTRSLQKATTMLMDNPLCMQLRYLQSLHMIAGDKTHTIVFPYSVDMFKNMLNNISQ